MRILMPNPIGSGDHRDSLITISILRNPPYKLPPDMRIPMPNPIGSGDHPGTLMFSELVADQICQEIVLYSFSNEKSKTIVKGARVVATPDGVWHKDSHYRSQLIGGVRKLMILIRDNLEEFLRNFIGEEIGGVRGTGTP